MSEICLLRFADVDPGVKEAYAAWYRSPHIPEVARVPGITAIQGYQAQAHPSFPAPAWGFAVIIHTPRNALELIGDIGARMASGEIGPGPADGAPSLLLAASPVGAHRAAPGAVAADRPELLLALTNPQGEDQHEAFNDWYDRQHLDDVLAVPGFLGARRYRIAPETAGQASPWSYLAIYEIAPGRSAEALAELSRRAGSDAMLLSPTLDMQNIYAQLYLPLA